MPYQHPLVVRYDDEGRADGLKETNYLVVSSISASDWVGLPVAGGGLAVSDAGIGQIYFREDAGSASGITLPDPNTSGYLNVSTNDAGDPVYSWGPGGAAGIPPYSVNATGEPDAESVWTFNGLNAEFITPTELNTALGSYAQTTALAAFVEIDDAGATNEIYYKSGDDAADGITAPTTPGTYLSWTGSNFAWQTPAGASPPVQSTTEASLWYFSGISGIAVSAVSATSSAFIPKSVFTGSRRVLYSTAANTPAETSQGLADQVLSIDNPAATVVWRNLSELPALTAIDSRVGTIEANYVSSQEFDQLETSAAQISAVVNTINSTYITTDAANAAYVNVAGDTMTGRLFLDKGVSSASTCMFDDVVYFRDETEGLSSIDMHFKVKSLSSYSPFSIVEGLTPDFWKSYIQFAGQETFGSYPEAANASSNLSIAVGLLDHWLYKHINDFNNPASETQASHWSLAGLRDRTVNLLSATDASALKDINYSTTPSEGQVLTWQTNAWVPQNSTGGASALSSLADVDFTISPVVNDFIRYDGTVWKTINGNILFNNDATTEFAGAGFLFTPDTSATSGLDIDEGLLYYDDNTKTLLLRSANQTDLRLGQEVSLRVINNTGTTLNIGTVVYVSGTFATMPAIALASASAEATTHKGMGVLKETLNHGDRGLMMLFGSLTGVDTSLFNVGDILYLGVTPGNLTNLYASAPSHPELIGSVIDVGSSGTILIHVQHGYEINELHNVSRTPASATGQVLVWDNTGGYYAPGSHNDLAGLTTGNPHTQYATLSGATFTGNVLTPTLSATTVSASGDVKARYFFPGNQNSYYIRNESNRIEFASVIGGRFFAADSQNAVVIPTNGTYGFGPGDADTYISRASAGIVRATSSIQALSSIIANISISTPALSATNISGVSTLNATSVTSTSGFISTLSATTYLNLPTDTRPLPFTIFNPTSGLIVPLFYGKYISNINEIQSVLVGGTSASWSIYETADASDPESGTEIIASQTTNSITTGNSHSGSTFTENWIVLKIHTVSGAVTQLHLTLLTY